MFPCSSLPLLLLFLLPLLFVCSAGNQQMPYTSYSQQMPYYPLSYQQPNVAGGYQQPQYRQFGQQPFGPYSSSPYYGGYRPPYGGGGGGSSYPYSSPYSSSYPYSSPYSSQYSSPYSSNSYYGYGTNSPAWYQQNRPFGQSPYGGASGSVGGSRYPYGGVQYDPYGGAGGSSSSNFYSSSPFSMFSSSSSSPFDQQQFGVPPFPFGADSPLGKKTKQKRSAKSADLTRQKRHVQRVKREQEDGNAEDEFSGLSLNLPLMSLAVPEMPTIPEPGGPGCNMQKNPEEGEYFMALQFIC